MSLPASSYSTNGLSLRFNDINPWLIGSNRYAECITNYFSIFQSRSELEKELQRPDINTVCKKELDDIRAVVADIRYKEVLGYQGILMRNDFYEELLVKNKP